VQQQTLVYLIAPLLHELDSQRRDCPPTRAFCEKAALTFEEVKKDNKSHSISQTQQDWHASGSERYPEDSVFAERVVGAHDISSEQRSGYEDKHLRGSVGAS